MDLFLLRHAKTKATAGELELSAEGREQVTRLIQQMQKRDLVPSLILSSPLCRAKQTAEMVAEALDYSSIHMESWIGEGLPAERFLRELAVYQEFESVLVVGHEPDLSRMVEYLLSVQSGAVKFKKGTLVWLQGITPPSRGATLKLLLPPH